MKARFTYYFVVSDSSKTFVVQVAGVDYQDAFENAKWLHPNFEVRPIRTSSELLSNLRVG